MKYLLEMDEKRVSNQGRMPLKPVNRRLFPGALPLRMETDVTDDSDLPYIQSRRLFSL
jgi:hypothetical protein